MGRVENSVGRGAPAPGPASSLSTRLGKMCSQASHLALRSARGGTRLAAPVWLALSLALVAFADGGRGGGLATGVSGGADSATRAGGDGSTGGFDVFVTSGGGAGGWVRSLERPV